jgi:hypothetical protein
MIAVGGVLVVKGHAIAGLALDALGAISIWAAFKTYTGGLAAPSRSKRSRKG